MNIVLIGIQGSGKGELIKRLSKNFDFTLISVGALFRQEIAKNSVLGKKVGLLMAQGNLVGIDITMQVLKKAIKNKDGNFVFDGFPRTMEQAIELDKICKVDKAIFLKLDKAVAKKRLLNRLTCVSCQFVTSKAEAKGKVCPICNGKLAVRTDDSEEGINQRFKVFEQVTLPIVEKYRAEGVLVEVDASKSKDEVYNSVKKVLK